MTGWTQGWCELPHLRKARVVRDSLIKKENINQIPPPLFLCGTAMNKWVLVKSSKPVESCRCLIKIVFFSGLYQLKLTFNLIHLRDYLPPGLVGAIILSKLPCFLPSRVRFQFSHLSQFDITHHPSETCPWKRRRFQALQKIQKSKIWELTKKNKNHVQNKSRCPISLSPLQSAMLGWVPWILFVTNQFIWVPR